MEQFAVNDERKVVDALRREGYEPVWKDWDATYDGCARSRERARADAAAG